MSKIEIQLEEAKEVFLLLEKLQDFMHQPMNCESKEDFVKFIKSVYPEVRKSYYETVWNWLPEQVQQEIEER
jgi:uncharacterized protein YeeX (DUF496 family)